MSYLRYLFNLSITSKSIELCPRDISKEKERTITITRVIIFFSIISALNIHFLCDYVIGQILVQHFYYTNTYGDKLSPRTFDYLEIDSILFTNGFFIRSQEFSKFTR